jgi:hypothetical protein
MFAKKTFGVNIISQEGRMVYQKNTSDDDEEEIQWFWPI